MLVGSFEVHVRRGAHAFLLERRRPASATVEPHVQRVLSLHPLARCPQPSPQTALQHNNQPLRLVSSVCIGVGVG
eukprot:1178078-Prorocentrum_minimum.AAC.1